MTFLDLWLKENQTNIFEHIYCCGESTRVPVDPGVFHSCFIRFMDSVKRRNNGKSDGASTEFLLCMVLLKSCELRSNKLEYGGIMARVAVVLCTDVFN